MNDKPAQPTPTMLALELRGFAKGVQVIAEQLESGSADDATKEQQVDAENAAHALLRNAPLAIKAIRKLEDFADRTAENATERRDAIMTSMFGPDTE